MAARAHRLTTEDEREIPDDTRLALLVLQKAINDAYFARLRPAKTVSAAMVTVKERIAARCFCEAQTGEWADARRAWAHQALIDPDVLDRRIQRIREQAVPAMAAE